MNYVPNGSTVRRIARRDIHCTGRVRVVLLLLLYFKSGRAFCTCEFGGGVLGNLYECGKLSLLLLHCEYAVAHSFDLAGELITTDIAR